METLHLLVVDDEMGMRLGVARALRDFAITLPVAEDAVGLTVDQAATGQEALDKIAERVPDLLLLDHKLPDMTGLDILDRLKEQALDVQTIMVTAYASLETAVTATKRGAYDFLAKPFTPDELKDAVRKAARNLMLQREARRLAEEKRQIRFRFISVLAHEMKAPLAAVEGYLRIMQDKAAGDDPAVYDRMLDRSLIRLEGMRKMIFDLLDLTAIESGQKKRELADTDLREIAETAIDTFVPAARERGIAVELDAPETLPFFGDRSELEIVFNNLISNAVKYNRDNGKVFVTLRGDAREAIISVRDTGLGMSEKETARLFQDFVRIKNEKTRNILGSGLGLSTVKKISLLYNGETAVTSEPDVGSTFTVILRETKA